MQPCRDHAKHGGAGNLSTTSGAEARAPPALSVCSRLSEAACSTPEYPNCKSVRSLVSYNEQKRRDTRAATAPRTAQSAGRRPGGDKQAPDDVPGSLPCLPVAPRVCLSVCGSVCALARSLPASQPVSQSVPRTHATISHPLPKESRYCSRPNCHTPDCAAYIISSSPASSVQSVEHVRRYCSYLHILLFNTEDL